VGHTTTFNPENGMREERSTAIPHFLSLFSLSELTGDVI